MINDHITDKELEMLAAEPENNMAFVPNHAMAKMIARELLARRQAAKDTANCLGFFASVIKSGEPWTATCQREYDKANGAMAMCAASVKELSPEAWNKLVEVPNAPPAPTEALIDLMSGQPRAIRREDDNE